MTMTIAWMIRDRSECVGKRVRVLLPTHGVRLGDECNERIVHFSR
jgi:hypothetical protein